MANKKNNNPNTGVTILVICGLLAVALIVGCVFFPDVIFGMFQS